MSNQSESVWMLGSGSMFCIDLFRSKAACAARFIKYIFHDENNHWIGKLGERDQKTLLILKDAYDAGKLEIEDLAAAYNEKAAKDDKWHIKQEFFAND